MCKHIAAVLYGVGARLDQKPELLFGLRQVNAKDLVNQAGACFPISKKGPVPGKVLDDSLLSDVFGIEMDDDVALKKPSPSKKVAPGKKSAPKALKTATGKAMTVAKKKTVVKEVISNKQTASAKNSAKSGPALEKVKRA